MCAISLAWARAIRASVCSLACRAKKSASSTGGVEFAPVSSLRDGRFNICGLVGACFPSSCFEPRDVGVDPGDVSFSEPGDSVSDDVSFIKQIWRFIPEEQIHFLSVTWHSVSKESLYSRYEVSHIGKSDLWIMVHLVDTRNRCKTVLYMQIKKKTPKSMVFFTHFYSCKFF